MSCPYRSLGGEPGKSFHETRFLGFSVVDVVGTFFFFAVPTMWMFKGNVSVYFLIWIVIGEIFHYVFGVQTAGMDTLGITACPG